MTDAAIIELAPQVGVRAACKAVGAAQAGYYRRHRQSPPPPRPEPIPHRARHQPRASATPSSRRSSTSCTVTGFLTWPRPKCGRFCSTRASTWDRSRRSTDCCARPVRCVNAAARSPHVARSSNLPVRRSTVSHSSPVSTERRTALHRRGESPPTPSNTWWVSTARPVIPAGSRRGPKLPERTHDSAAVSAAPNSDPSWVQAELMWDRS